MLQVPLRKKKNQLLGARTAMMDTAAKISELQGRLQSLATEINILVVWVLL